MKVRSSSQEKRERVILCGLKGESTAAGDFSAILVHVEESHQVGEQKNTCSQVHWGVRYSKGKIIRSYVVNNTDHCISRMRGVVVALVERWICKYENIMDNDKRKTAPLKDITAAF